MSAFCWKCGQALPDLPKRISFREICPQCHVHLHACKNCQNYEVGRPNDCKVPGTDPITDREANNFCEEFLMLGKPPAPKPNANDAFKHLFGE